MIVILFSLINIPQADQITTILILSLLIFGLLIFSLVSMADPKVVDFLQKRFGKNLLSALIDNHIYWGNKLNIDVRRIVWKRVMDMNDRALRAININTK